MSRIAYVLFVAAIALSGAAACGKSSSKPAAPSGTAAPATPGAPATAAAPVAKGAPATTPAGTPAGGCHAVVTGDVNLTIDAVAARHPPNSKAMAGTDYWMSDGDMKNALRTMVGMFDGKKSTPAQLDAKVDEAMKKDPRLMLLLINCGTDEGSFHLSPTNRNHYADVPFAPGKYPIARSGAKDEKPGTFGAMIVLRPGGKVHAFQVSDEGSIELTRFDIHGIAGKFDLKAKSFDGKESIAATGTFDFPCIGTSICKD